MFNQVKMISTPLTEDETTMNTIDDEETMTTGDFATATFDDLPDELRRVIMMMRAYMQAQIATDRCVIEWMSSSKYKFELAEECREAGFKALRTKNEMRRRLGEEHCEMYIRHVRRCELAWQPAEFNRGFFDQLCYERAVRVWWKRKHPALYPALHVPTNKHAAAAS